MHCSSQMRLRSGVAVAVAQAPAAALILPVAWEFTYAKGVVIKRGRGGGRSIKIDWGLVHFLPGWYGELNPKENMERQVMIHLLNISLVVT